MKTEVAKIGAVKATGSALQAIDRRGAPLASITHPIKLQPSGAREISAVPSFHPIVTGSVSCTKTLTLHAPKAHKIAAGVPTTASGRARTLKMSSSPGEYEDSAVLRNRRTLGYLSTDF